MMYVNKDIPDRDIVEKWQNLESQRQRSLQKEIDNMVNLEDEWVPAGFNPDSLFLMWKFVNPLIDDPRVFKSVIAERNLFLPAPEWGSTLYEYIKKDKKTIIVWSLPEKIIIESGAYKAFDWDEISLTSLEAFKSRKLLKYVRNRNRTIQRKICRLKIS